MQAIIFDLDGVLVETTQYARPVVNAMLEPHGISLSEADFKPYIGMTIAQRVEHWNKKYHLNFNIERFTRDFIAGQIEAMKESLMANKSVLQLLDSLKKKRYRLALVTSSRRVKAAQILDFLGVRKHFEVVLTAEDVAEHKPDPTIYTQAAAGLGVSPAECLVIEDSPSGIKAGKRAGMTVLALKTPLFTEEDLDEADAIIQDLSELEQF